MTYSFLRQLTDARVTDRLVAQATRETISYLEGKDELSRHELRDLASRRARSYLSGRDFHKHVVKTATHGLMCRFVELAGCGDNIGLDGARTVGLADAFVSWNWDSPWESVIGALGEHTRRVIEAGGDAPHYWLDLFAVNQHTALPPWSCDSGLGDKCPGCAAVGADMMSLDEMTAGRRDKGFERVINSSTCKETLVLLEPWGDPRPTSRVWVRLFSDVLTSKISH